MDQRDDCGGDCGRCQRCRAREGAEETARAHPCGDPHDCYCHEGEDVAAVIRDLRAEVAEAERNARFVEKVREIADRTQRNLHDSQQSDESILTDLFGDIRQALREHDESQPVEPVKE